MYNQESDPKSNPFFHNYIFSEKDLKRTKIRWWQLPLFLWFAQTYTQGVYDSNIGNSERNKYIFHYKVWGAKYYLIKIENQKAVVDGDFISVATLKNVI